MIVYQEIMSKSRNWKVMEPVDELPHVNAETLVIVSQIYDRGPSVVAAGQHRAAVQRG